MSAWKLQKQFHQLIKNDDIPSTVLFLEHENVYTLGKNANKNYLLNTFPDIDVVDTDRGGEITYHGPGQLVGYPIINLNNYHKSITWFINSLEQIIINTHYRHEKINDFIIQELHSTILEYIESFKFDWFAEWTGYSSIKFLRYYPGQTMQSHCDHIRSMFDGERKGVPILSIIGILNDDYEGGELIMFEDKKIDTKKGDLLIFPSNFLYPHKVTPVTEGVRYSYVSWVW